MLRYHSEKDNAYRILDLTSLTVAEFDHLVDPFDRAFVRHMRDWTMEGRPRTARLRARCQFALADAGGSVAVCPQLSEGGSLASRSRRTVRDVRSRMPISGSMCCC